MNHFGMLLLKPDITYFGFEALVNPSYDLLAALSILRFVFTFVVMFTIVHFSKVHTVA